MDILEALKEYIKPELLVLVLVLYLVGLGLKKTEKVNDKYIPLILGLLGIVISSIYVVATSSITGYQSVLMMVFTALVQGILVAGASVYINQVVKQTKKEE